MIPNEWTPSVKMERIIAHWTAGGHKANDTDRKAYHVLVEGDANVVRGVPSIAANSGSLKNGYAAHTLNCNTGSIGVSMCGMAGAVESPFDPGRAPLTEIQFMQAAAVVAELCRRYDIPVTPRTVLFHAEVQATLGITQRNKWDVAVLPFDRTVRGARAIGDMFRALVSAALGKMPEPVTEAPVPTGGQGRVTAESGLNFRRAPSLSAESTGNLPFGTVVEVDGAEGAWLQVTTPAGYTGWVSRQYVDVFDGPPVEAPTTPDPRRAVIAEMRAMLDKLEASL